MLKATDRQYLRDDQYRTSTNLDIRLSMHARFSTNPQGWQSWLVQTLDLVEDVRVLECGCGPGTLWAVNVGRIPTGVRLTLTDLSEGMARKSSEALAATGKVDVACAADVQSVPFADDSFDIVVANHMLYHVPDRQRAAAEVVRVLRPGGRLIAATNGESHLKEFQALARELDEAARSEAPERAFSLENGAAQLSPWFDRVERLDYADGLRVTDADAIVDYLRSGLIRPEVPVDELRARLAAHIDREGAFDVTKSAGVFVGVKAG